MSCIETGNGKKCIPGVCFGVRPGGPLARARDWWGQNVLAVVWLDPSGHRCPCAPATTAAATGGRADALGIFCRLRQHRSVGRSPAFKLWLLLSEGAEGVGEREQLQGKSVPSIPCHARPLAAWLVQGAVSHCGRRPHVVWRSIQSIPPPSIPVWVKCENDCTLTKPTLPASSCPVPLCAFARFLLTVFVAVLQREYRTCIRVPGAQRPSYVLLRSGGLTSWRTAATNASSRTLPSATTVRPMYGTYRR